MSLHRLTNLTIGVPEIEPVASYYEDFGLKRVASTTEATSFATVDGGEQLRLVRTNRRRLVQIAVGVDDPDDIARVAADLTALDVAYTVEGDRLLATDPGTEVEVKVEVASRIVQAPFVVPSYNAPGTIARPGQRALGLGRTEPIRPRKLGHVVIGSTRVADSLKFFTDGIGFKISDYIGDKAAFLRCSTDHHNLLVQSSPVSFLHHTSWQVDDVDDVGRGAKAMLDKDEDRHAWGLGRHHVGSNFFWYLKDPAGNFSEYYSDMDCIVEDALWEPQDWIDTPWAFYNWGVKPPTWFTSPEDIKALIAAEMTGAHSS